MKILRVLALLLLLQSSVMAADRWSHVVLWGGAVADLVSTRVAISRGAHEANPIVGEGFGRQAGVVLASTAVIELLTRACEKDGFPVMARNARIVFGLVHGVAAGWNVRVAMKLGKKK